MGWNPPPRWRRLDSDYYLFRQPNPEAMKDEIQTVLPPRMTVTWKTRGNVSNPWDFGKHADVPSRELTYIIPHQTGSSEFSPSKGRAWKGRCDRKPVTQEGYSCENSWIRSPFQFLQTLPSFSGNPGLKKGLLQNRCRRIGIPQSLRTSWESITSDFPSEKTQKLLMSFHSQKVSGIKVLQKSLVKLVSW